MPDNLNIQTVPSGAYVEPEDDSIIEGFPETPPPVPPGLIALGEYSGGQHVLYMMEHSYRYVSGQQQMPIAAATGVARFVQLHAPTMLHRVIWSCKRIGSLPICPSPVAPDSNHVLLVAEIKVLSPGLIENCTTPEYTVSGEYVYGMASPVWVDVGLSMGTMPWTTMPLSGNVLSPGAFITGLF